MVATGTLRDGLFYLDTPSVDDPNKISLMDARIDKGEAQLLHERWGHCSWKRLAELMRRMGNDRITAEDRCFCAACIQAKSHAKATHYEPGPKPHGPLDVVIADGVGPIPVTSTSGYRYYEHLRCIWSHYNWVLFARKKSDYPINFQKWHEYITKQIGRPIKVLHTGHDTETKSKDFSDWLLKNGIKREFAAPRASEEAGLSKELTGHSTRWHSLAARGHACPILARGGVVGLPN